MAAAGVRFDQIATVDGDPESVVREMVAAVSGTQGYSMNNSGSGVLVLTRKYTPTWAIVLAIIGVLILLLGLLFLLVRKTETLTVTVRATAAGTQVRVAGLATRELQSRVNAVIDSRRASPAAPEAPAA